MEQLFSAVRDITLTSRMTEADAEKVRCLIDGLRMPSTPDWDSCKAHLLQGANTPCDRRAGAKQAGAGGARDEAETGSEVLNSQLQSAKELLQQRLKATRPAW